MAIQTVTKEYNNRTPKELTSYKLVYVGGENWSVPIDDDNRHYIEIQEWVADGNTIAEPA